MLAQGSFQRPLFPGPPLKDATPLQSVVGTYFSYLAHIRQITWAWNSSGLHSEGPMALFSSVMYKRRLALRRLGKL